MSLHPDDRKSPDANIAVTPQQVECEKFLTSLQRTTNPVSTATIELCKQFLTAVDRGAMQTTLAKIDPLVRNVPAVKDLQAHTDRVALIQSLATALRVHSLPFVAPEIAELLSAKTVDVMPALNVLAREWIDPLSRFTGPTVRRLIEQHPDAAGVMKEAMVLGINGDDHGHALRCVKKLAELEMSDLSGIVTSERLAALVKDITPAERDAYGISCITIARALIPRDSKYVAELCKEYDRRYLAASARKQKPLEISVEGLADFIGECRVRSLQLPRGIDLFKEPSAHAPNIKVEHLVALQVVDDLCIGFPAGKHPDAVQLRAYRLGLPSTRFTAFADQQLHDMKYHWVVVVPDLKIASHSIYKTVSCNLTSNDWVRRLQEDSCRSMQGHIFAFMLRYANENTAEVFKRLLSITPGEPGSAPTTMDNFTVREVECTAIPNVIEGICQQVLFLERGLRKPSEHEARIKQEMANIKEIVAFALDSYGDNLGFLEFRAEAAFLELKASQLLGDDVRPVVHETIRLAESMSNDDELTMAVQNIKETLGLGEEQ